MQSPSDQPEDLIRLVALGKPLSAGEMDEFARLITRWVGRRVPVLSASDLASSPFSYLALIFRTELGFSRPGLAAAMCLMPSGWEAFTYMNASCEVRVQVWQRSSSSLKDLGSVHELWHFVREYWQVTGAKRRELGVTEVDALIAKFMEVGA